jgi:hypothetical protein
LKKKKNLFDNVQHDLASGPGSRHHGQISTGNLEIDEQAQPSIRAADVEEVSGGSGTDPGRGCEGTGITQAANLGD